MFDFLLNRDIDRIIAVENTFPQILPCQIKTVMTSLARIDCQCKMEDCQKVLILKTCSQLAAPRPDDNL